MKPYAFAFAVFVIPLAAGAAPADPWTLAPALPTACYRGQDKFFEQARTQVGKIQAEIERQRAINDEINGRAKAVDPQEQQSRMMAYMMEHPEDMQKVMEAMQSQGQTYTETALAASEEEIRQKQALDALAARYDAALKAATRPYYDKIAALPLCDGECTSPPSAIAEAKALYSQIDQEYVKLCGQWWKAGAFHTWFAGYRKLLVAKIPQQEKIDALARATNAMLGITGNYRSTEPLQEVEEYTELAIKIFGERWERQEFGRDWH